MCTCCIYVPILAFSRGHTGEFREGGAGNRRDSPSEDKEKNRQQLVLAWEKRENVREPGDAEATTAAND